MTMNNQNNASRHRQTVQTKRHKNCLEVMNEEVIDYAVIHELCHFIIKGQLHHFWELIRSYFPRYQDAIKWLDVNSSAMLLLPNFYSPKKK